MLPDGHLREALTFDDVLLVPADSEVIPRTSTSRTRLTAAHPRCASRSCRSAMDTVTEARDRDRMAREGGIGIIHKNLSHRGAGARGHQGQEGARAAWSSTR